MEHTEHFDLKRFSKSRNARRTIMILVVLALMLLSFQAGALIGRHRAEFAGRLGDNYMRMFGDRHEMPREFGIMQAPNMPGGYGATGKVISVNAGSFVVAGPDNTERIVRVGADTLIREFQDVATTTDIKTGDSVIVIGSPSTDGEILARLIRILPASMASTTAGTINQ